MSIPSSKVSCSRTSCGSESLFSGDSRCPLTKVPLDDLTSRIHILPARSAHTSACALDSTLESKYPLTGVGTVLAFVCRPTFSIPGWKGTLICFRSNVPFKGKSANTARLSPDCAAGSILRAPFCGEVTIGPGWWTADIAAAALGPDVMVGACGRVVVTLETGSALEAGQNPPLAFFFIDQWLESPFVVETGGCDGEEMVDVDEFDEDMEEEELVLWTVFRCGMNIRDTSSALIELIPPLPPLLLFHPSLDKGWKLGGEATAVVIG